MRIALITLALAALTFIGGIIWIFIQKNGIELLPQKTGTETKVSSETASLEILRSQWKTEERIKVLEAKIDALSGKNPTEVIGANGSGSTGATQVVASTNSSGVIIPISSKFLSKIITKVNLTLTKNNGIFGLYVFDTNNEYSTYTDTKSAITIITSRTPYETWLKNFKAIDASIFTINESKTFQFPSFYLNPAKTDNIIRIVMQVEAQTLLISLPKSKFTEFKTMLTKK